jgi:hypothetical protein
MTRQRALLLALGSALASPAAAHPGHGAPELASSWLHYATEPGHVLVLGSVVLGSVAGASLLARSRARRR